MSAISRPRRRRNLPHSIRPRIVSDDALAEYLGTSTSWLLTHRIKLEQQGLPRRLDVVGGNDLDKVDDWLDTLSQKPALEIEDPYIEQLWKKATGQCPKPQRNRATS